MKTLCKLSLISLGALIAAPTSILEAKKTEEASSSASPSSTTVERVVAVVNGQKIMFTEVLKALQERYPRLDPQAVDQVALNKAFNQFADGFVAFELVYQEAKKHGIEGDADYKKAMELIGRRKMADLFLERACKERVTLAAIQKAFDELPSQDKKVLQYRTIFVDKKSVADQVMHALKLGKTPFEEIAKKHSQDPNPGMLHETLEVFLPPELQVARTVKVKDHSSPILTKRTRPTEGGGRESVDGWVIIYVEERREAVREYMQDVLESLLVQRAQGELLRELKGKAKIEAFDYQGKPRTALEAMPANDKAAATKVASGKNAAQGKSSAAPQNK